MSYIVGKYGKKRKQNPEEILHIKVCNYIKTKYPGVIFTSDLSGIPMTKNMALKYMMLKSCKGIPDLLILEPRGQYYGLFIELKADKSSYLNKSGSLLSNEHIENQKFVIDILSSMSYRATFGAGEEECRKIIDEYMKLSPLYFQHVKEEIIVKQNRSKHSRWTKSLLKKSVIKDALAIEDMNFLDNNE